MTTDISAILARVSEVMAIVPDVVKVINDFGDKKFDHPDNLEKVVDFVLEKSDKLTEYVSPGEVLLLVAGIMGALTPGDTSGYYIALLDKWNDKFPA